MIFIISSKLLLLLRFHDIRSFDKFLHGCSFQVRGMTEDFAVLCTNHRTFELKLREISNTMLLCPDLQTADHLDGTASHKISRKEVGPLLDPLPVTLK